MTEDAIVYDRAKYHYEGQFPDIPQEQAFVHTGIFLGWVVDSGLCSEEFRTEFFTEIEAFRLREMTGPQLYATCDGVFSSDMVCDEGNAFVLCYFDFQSGAYLRDYQRLVASDLPTLYHVQDTWPNYFTLKSCVDGAYRDWKASAVLFGR